MPKLPDYTALGQSPVPQRPGGVASYQPADTRQEGAGFVQAGQIAEQAAELLQRANDRQDAMVAEAAYNTLQRKALELKAGENGFEQVKGAGVVGKPFLDGYQQRFDVQREQLATTLTPSQRRIFDLKAPVADLSFRSALMTHQAQETTRFNDQTDADTVEFARRQIFANPADPAAIQGGLADIDKVIERKGERMGWAPVTVAETKAKYREKVWEDAAGVLVERDPNTALAAMNKRMGIGQDPGLSGFPAFDALDPKKLVELHTRANSHVQQAANQARAEAEKRMKTAQETTEKLQDFTLTGQMVDPVYERTVIAATAGTPYEPVARSLIATSYMGAAHGSQTLPQQEESLRRVDAQLAASGSSPEQQKLVQHARQITETQRKAYEENPWAAASRFGKQTPVPLENITDASTVPQIVAHRLGLMTGVETYAGRPVSPLQPEEAQAFAQQLKALPPDARAEVLAQTGAMLNGPRGVALAEQLDKHDKPLALALKMGLDRTTGGRAASALVLRGAQAIADKTVKKDDSALTGWRHEIAPLVRGSVGDDQLESDIIEAAFYVRAAQEIEGVGGANFTKGVGSGAEDAIAMVAGRPLSRGGEKTLLPRGMKEADFDAKLKAYTPEKLREQAPAGEVYVRGTPVKVEQLSSHLGEYGMKLDPRTKRYTPVVRGAFVTLDKAGTQPLQLEMR